MTDEAPLFSVTPPDNGLIERRLYWLVGWHMQRRGKALSRTIGRSRNTLRAYADARPLAERADGRTGRRLSTLMEIMTALGIDWIAANLAAAHAHSPEDMLRLVAHYAGVGGDPRLIRRDGGLPF